MKIKARCPHCEIWQMFGPSNIVPGTTADVQCKMDWCGKVFDSSKTPKSPPPVHPQDLEKLKTS